MTKKIRMIVVVNVLTVFILKNLLLRIHYQ